MLNITTTKTYTGEFVGWQNSGRNLLDAPVYLCIIEAILTARVRVDLPECVERLA